jgi:hypothetical protein
MKAATNIAIYWLSDCYARKISAQCAIMNTAVKFAWLRTNGDSGGINGGTKNQNPVAPNKIWVKSQNNADHKPAF